ncbi:hypothetical protein [Actinoplanes aureus]|jgi:hypothetical protein|uniref:Uncharacterized protein n=1 Tax=Actinoplanes aureus TaxID=2792083 RepID=A0A931CB19_9ACTN|nr:hypothetical protein [Actinoplanes aureus]MBG0562818.1 hypothetical protein [Actinoplanes aureus]
MTIAIGTSTPSTVRETHAAWLRRREDSRPHPWRLMTEPAARDEQAAGAEQD